MSEHERQQQQKQIAVPNEFHRKKNWNKKALIIAISNYKNLPKSRQLSFCKNDGEEMFKVLSKHGYEIPVNFRLTGKVGGIQMRDAIVDFFSCAKSTETLIFYFSGHGMPDGHGNYFLAASDIEPKRPQGRGYAFYELEQERKRCDARRIVTILDCCFSGAAESGTIMAGDEEGIANVARDRMNDTFKEGEGRCLLASSLGDQYSYKMHDKDYSIFTYFLIEGIKGANGKSVDPRGYVTALSLSNYLYEMVTAKGRQKPITKTALSGDIIIARYPGLVKRQKKETPHKDHLIKLLTDGKIDEFNRIRRSDNYSKLDLYNLDLSGKDLSYVDLRNSDLNLVNLRLAKLHSSIFLGTHFLDTNLSGADLFIADLSGAHLSNANLFGARLQTAVLANADLSCANLSNANLTWANLLSADLSNANLFGARLQNASLIDAKLVNAKLVNAKLRHTDLASADLSNADLSLALLQNAALRRAVLSGANLSSVHFVEANLSLANLSNADLSRAFLDEASIVDANLTDAILRSAHLSRANLYSAILKNADLSGAILIHTELSKADLSGANLSSSIIIGWKFANNEDYPLCKDAKFDNTTIIDDENLSMHFHNSNAKNVPPVIKDKKELRKKLEERGFGRLFIDRFL